MVELRGATMPAQTAGPTAGKDGIADVATPPRPEDLVVGSQPRRVIGVSPRPFLDIAGPKGRLRRSLLIPQPFALTFVINTFEDPMRMETLFILVRGQVRVLAFR